MLNFIGKMKVLVTGGAGFIGSHLCLKLAAKGYDVTVFDNLSEQIHGKNGDTPLLRSIEGKVNLIKGDVRDRDAFRNALSGQDIVIHYAAETGTGQSMYSIERYADVNVRGTAILLDIIVNEQHRVKKIVVASSRAIYGEGEYKCPKHGTVHPGPRTDQDMMKGCFEVKCPHCLSAVVLMPTSEEALLHPGSIYGISKLNQEQMVMTVGKSLGIPCVAFRYQNVYGPGQSLSNPYTGILSIFSNLIRSGRDVNVFEDGMESRDFIYIDDVIDATVLGIEKEQANYEVFNVGTGIPTTVIEVAERLIQHYGAHVRPVVTGHFRSGDIRHNFANLSKIQTRLGFNPRTNFATGLQEFADWVAGQQLGPVAYEKSIEELKSRGLFK